jgi:hypothetical protein
LLGSGGGEDEEAGLSFQGLNAVTEAAEGKRAIDIEGGLDLEDDEGARQVE